MVNFFHTVYTFINFLCLHQDQDLPPEPATLPFLDGDLTENEPVTPDGSLCNCEACTERR